MTTELIIHHNGSTAYLPGVKAAVLVQKDSGNMFAEPDSGPSVITVSNLGDDAPKVVPWGLRNDLPQDLIDKAYKLPQITSNLWFNIVASYGDSIKPVKVEFNEKGEKVITPFTGNDEVTSFFEENDIDGYLLEQLTDMHWFFNVFPEVIFNRENGDKRKIIEIRSKEAAFSRWCEMDKKTGRIPYHYYFAWWGTKQPNDDYKCYATHVLDQHNPVRHLREIMKEDEKKEWNTRRNSFIVPVTFPTPGRNYYQKPYWYSLIESGWYDFATKIPEFKKSLMNNQIGIKYVVYISEDYFPEIFRRERIATDKDQLARIKKEYADINNFLKGAEKAGRSVIAFEKKDPTGKPYPLIRFEALKNGKEGGDYIEDSEEVSNIIAYGMLVHPSLVGATPGKNKNISGTEARELFILKQAILKPFRDRILKPFYLIKAINRWPSDLHFVIPNIELTTLDTSKTGSVTKVSTP